MECDVAVLGGGPGRLHGRHPRGSARRADGLHREGARARRHVPPRRLHPDEGVGADRLRAQGGRGDVRQARRQGRRGRARLRGRERLEGGCRQAADRRASPACSRPTASSGSRARAASRTRARSRSRGRGRLVRAGRRRDAARSRCVRRSTGIDSSRCVDSTGLLAQEQVPRRLVVLGGGIIGCEFASIFARFGSRGDDRRAAADAHPAGGRRGRRGAPQALREARYRHPPRVAAARASRSGKAALLGALRRRPDGRVRPHAGRDRSRAARRGDRPRGGRRRVRRQARASRPTSTVARTSRNIYAVGDCAGYWQLAHTAFREGEVAAENACGHEAVVDNRGVPRPIYTDPEIAGVGLTEREAREQHGDDVLVGKFPFAANGRALMQNDTVGWVKSIHESPLRRAARARDGRPARHRPDRGRRRRPRRGVDRRDRRRRHDRRIRRSPRRSRRPGSSPSAGRSIYRIASGRPRAHRLAGRGRSPMKLNTREAIIGIITYRVLKHMVARKLTTKGGIVATKKKVGIIAAIGALIGALFFWRKKKASSAEL